MPIVRGIIILAGLLFLLLGMLFMLGISKLTGEWLNSYFIGACLLAYAIPTLYIGITQAYKALVGGALNVIVTFGMVGLFILRLSAEMPEIARLGEGALYIAILAVWLFLLGLRVKTRKDDRLPISTQWLFAVVFTIALAEGLFLLVPIPGHFPWLLTPELSVIFGWVLVGGALYYGWCMVCPIWENGYPGLYGLIVYSGLLIGPYLSLLGGTDVAVIPLYLWLAIIVSAGTGIWAIVELLRRYLR